METESWFPLEPEDQEDNVVGRMENLETKRAMQAIREGKFKAIINHLVGADWVDIVAALSWEAASFLKPNAKESDPKRCVKIKCIATGSPTESRVFKGFVFTSAADESQSAEYKTPKLLLINDDDEKMYINIAQDCKPDVVLVDKSLSENTWAGLGVTGAPLLFSNMELRRMQRIALIVSPITLKGVASKNIWQLDSFKLEDVVAMEGGIQRNKKLMFLEGGESGLGCTVLLMGADSIELKKIKVAVQRAVVMAYHFILGTYFFLKQHQMFSTIANVGTVDYISAYVSSHGDITRYEVQEKSDGFQVLQSKSNAVKEIICVERHLCELDQSSSIGAFLDKLLQQGDKCNTCKGPPEEHIYYYGHDSMKVMVEVQRQTKTLLGESDRKIWMWSCCSQCQNATTKRIQISEICALPFDKFLELNFESNSNPENTYRSCCERPVVYFIGLGSMAARFTYYPFVVHSISLPPQKMDKLSSTSGMFPTDESTAVKNQGIQMFDDIKRSLGSLNNQGSSKDLSDSMNMLNQETEHFEYSIQSMSTDHMLSLRVNYFRLEILVHSCIWKRRLELLNSNSPQLENDEIWEPSDRIMRKCMDALRRGYLPNFIPDDTPNIYIPLNGFYDGVVMDYDGELSSIIACALSFLHTGNKRKETDDNAESNSIFLENLSQFCYSKANDLAESSLVDFDNFDHFSMPIPYDVESVDVFFGVKNRQESNKFVKCFNAMKFQSLRQHFSLSEYVYISSLSRCKKWNAQGGKSGAFFAKTVDDKFIIKGIQGIELESFKKSSSEYFNYMLSCGKDKQTCLAKIFGIYQVISGKETHNVMIMENIFFGKQCSKQYDLKGVGRGKIVQDVSGMVLKEKKFILDMNTRLVCTSNILKKNFMEAVRNDAAFLEGINVMDYSVLVGVIDDDKLMICGMIDHWRKFTERNMFGGKGMVSGLC